MAPPHRPRLAALAAVLVLAALVPPPPARAAPGLFSLTAEAVAAPGGLGPAVDLTAAGSLLWVTRVNATFHAKNTAPSAVGPDALTVSGDLADMEEPARAYRAAWSDGGGAFVAVSNFSVGLSNTAVPGPPATGFTVEHAASAAESQEVVVVEVLVRLLACTMDAVGRYVEDELPTGEAKTARLEASSLSESAYFRVTAQYTAPVVDDLVPVGITIAIDTVSTLPATANYGFGAATARLETRALASSAPTQDNLGSYRDLLLVLVAVSGALLVLALLVVLVRYGRRLTWRQPDVKGGLTAVQRQAVLAYKILAQLMGLWPLVLSLFLVSVALRDLLEYTAEAEDDVSLFVTINNQSVNLVFAPETGRVLLRNGSWAATVQPPPDNFTGAFVLTPLLGELDEVDSTVNVTGNVSDIPFYPWLPTTGTPVRVVEQGSPDGAACIEDFGDLSNDIAVGVAGAGADGGGVSAPVCCGGCEGPECGFCIDDGPMSMACCPDAVGMAEDMNIIILLVAVLLLLLAVGDTVFEVVFLYNTDLEPGMVFNAWFWVSCLINLGVVIVTAVYFGQSAGASSLVCFACGNQAAFSGMFTLMQTVITSAIANFSGLSLSLGIAYVFAFDKTDAEGYNADSLRQRLRMRLISLYAALVACCRRPRRPRRQTAPAAADPSKDPVMVTNATLQQEEAPEPEQEPEREPEREPEQEPAPAPAASAPRTVGAGDPHQLNIPRLRNLQVAFRRADEDGSGLIQGDELVRCITDVGAGKLSADQVAQIVRLIDPSGAGLDYAQFVHGLHELRREHGDEGEGGQSQAPGPGTGVAPSDVFGFDEEAEPVQ